MRAGFGFLLSVFVHGAILLFGLVALPQARPFDSDDLEALPIELVTLDELTDLTEGSEKSEVAPIEEPQPIAEQFAPEPTPVEAEQEAETLVEAALEPEPEPEPQLEPEPELIDELAALIEEPEPIAEEIPEAQPETPDAESVPVQDAVLPPPKPQSRPQPPARPVPPAPKAVESEPDDFDPDDISALLNKQDAAGGGTPRPADEEQTFGSQAGADEAAMTQSEVEALKARLYKCWNPPRGVREARALRVTIGIKLTQDGRLAAAPEIIESGYDPLSQLAAESAVRAVQVCAPYDILPQDKYHVWREIEFVFDPREMLDG